MKKFVFAFIIFLAGLTGLFAGLGSLSFNRLPISAAADPEAQPCTLPGVPYYYLSDPQMLTADPSGNIYIVNRTEGGESELLVFQTYQNIKKYSLDSPPAFIKFEGSFLFIFYSDSVSIYNPSTLPNQPVNPTPTPTYSITLSTSIGSLSFFDVWYSSATSTYRIFLAGQTQYGSCDYTLSGSSPNLSPAFSPQSFSIGGQTIAGITADQSGSIYITALDPRSDPAGEKIYNIYGAGNTTPVNQSYLRNLESLTRLDGYADTFAAVADGTLTVFSRSLQTTIDPKLGNTYYTYESKSPAFITAVERRIFVIDSAKKSVDEYSFNAAAGSLEFKAVILASRGQDSGFYNIPEALTLVGDGEYIIADRAGQLRLINGTAASDFITDGTLNFPDIRAMCFNGLGSVYMYDNNSGNILVYSIAGKLQYTVPTDLSVIQLLSDSAGEVFITASTGVYKLGKTPSGSLTIVPAATTEANKTTPITPADRAVYSEISHGLVWTLGTASEKAIDIAADAFGSTFQLTKDTATGTLYIKTADGTDTPLLGATADEISPSMNFDRLTNKLYWIGAHNAAECATLEMPTFSGDGTPDNYDAQAALAMRDDDNSKFLTCTADTIISRYPNGLAPLTLCPKGAVLKVLCKEPQIGMTAFPSPYVLYESPASHEYFTGYVSAAAAQPAEAGNSNSPYSDDFGFVAANTTNSARVIYNNTVIYKYPTSNNLSSNPTMPVSLGVLPKNYDNPANPNARGLVLSHKLGENAADSAGFGFYEIRLSLDSALQTYTPDPSGDYVGYVNTNSVIDYYLPPSTKKFIANATVNFPRSLGDGLAVYVLQNGQFIALGSQTLANNQSIRINQALDKSLQYTYVTYYDAELGMTMDGWIETKYIVPYGISALQLAALITLIVILAAASFTLFLRHRGVRDVIPNRQDYF